MTPRGSFGYQTVLGTCDAHWAPGEYATPLMGLPVAGQHVWGGLAAGGHRLLPIRHFVNEVAARALVYRATPGEDFTFVPTAAYSGLCEVGELDGRWGIRQPGTPPRFVFTTAADGTGRWREHGVLDLELELVPEALQFATPDAEEPLVYLARAFRVRGGTALGAPATGFAFHEQVYVRSGQGWALTRHKRQLQGVWTAFATQYADGAVDWGQICWGTRGWSFVIVIRSDGPPILCHRPPAEIRLDPDGFPERLDVDLGVDGVWGWDPPAGGGGRVPLPGPRGTTPRWSEGVVTRRGADREVAFAHTWSEAYPAHLF